MTESCHEFIPEINSENYPDYQRTCYTQPSNFLGLRSNDPYYDIGPSNPHVNYNPPPLRPLRPALQTYTVEGGWQEDGDGRIHHVGHGVLEEVNSDGNPLEPRPDPIVPLDDHGVFIITEPLPPCTTPPPPPRPRYQRLLSPSPWPPLMRRNTQGWASLGMSTPTAPATPPLQYARRTQELDLLAANRRLSEILSIPTDYRTVHQPSARSASQRGHLSTEPYPLCSTPPLRRKYRPSPLSRSASPWPQVSDIKPRQDRASLNIPTPPYQEVPRHQENEPDLLANNVRLVELASSNVDDICSFFRSISHHHDVLPHTDMCSRVKTSLSALTVVLQRRSRLREEQLELGSKGWHKKYTERLSSLQRTLQKLCEFITHLGNYYPKLKTINKGLDKLEEYESKLSNLASKFNSLFDRLRVRHLHRLLSQAHAEAQQARKDARSARDLPQWAEEKSRRAELRRQYHAYRNGRRTSLVS